MQESKQSDPKQQNRKRNPEMAVGEDGFEHDLSFVLHALFRSKSSIKA
jgi:hypothetical protein